MSFAGAEVTFTSGFVVPTLATAASFDGVSNSERLMVAETTASYSYIECLLLLAAPSAGGRDAAAVRSWQLRRCWIGWLGCGTFGVALGSNLKASATFLFRGITADPGMGTTATDL